MASITAKLANRHSIRQFLPDPLTKAQLKEIERCLLSGGSLLDLQPISYLVVTNKEKLTRIATATYNAMNEQTQKFYASRVATYGISQAITCDAPAVIFIYKNNRPSDVCNSIEVGMAAMTVCAVATEQGLGSLVIGCFRAAAGKFEDELGLKPNAVLAAVAIGKPRPDAIIAEKKIENRFIIEEETAVPDDPALASSE